MGASALVYSLFHAKPLDLDISFLGNISGEATILVGNSFREAMRQYRLRADTMPYLGDRPTEDGSQLALQIQYPSNA